MAGKRRKPTKYNIPYVHVNKGRIEYRPRINEEQKLNGIPADKNGFLKPPIKLGVDGDSLEKVTSAWLAALNQIKVQAAYKKCTLGWIWSKYSKSRQFIQLVPASQKRNHSLIRILNHTIIIQNKDAPLADMHINEVNKPFFQKLAEKRLEQYQQAGKKGHSQVNKEITLISTMITWATNYLTEFADLGIDNNPLRGLKKLPEKPNTRYVTDQEYEIQYQLAAEIADFLQPVIEITYLCALRGIETLDIQLTDCTEEGIRTRRRKNSNDNTILWSPRLKKAYEAALKLHQKRQSPYLIPGFDNGKLAKSTLDDAFSRLKRKMKKEGISGYWSLHLIKAKAVSDSKDKHIAGHKTEQMRQRYDVKIQTRKPAK